MNISTSKEIRKVVENKKAANYGIAANHVLRPLGDDNRIYMKRSVLVSN